MKLKWTDLSYRSEAYVFSSVQARVEVRDQNVSKKFPGYSALVMLMTSHCHYICRKRAFKDREEAKRFAETEVAALVPEIQKFDLINELYEKLYERTESFNYKNIGSMGFYLVGAIAKNTEIQLTERQPFYRILKSVFPEQHDIWKHVQVINFQEKIHNATT